MAKITVSDIELSNGSVMRIFHNLPTQGINTIQDAVNSWTARTDDYSPESFCKYVNGKFTGGKTFAMTEQQYKKELDK
jgi:hypothetical protein